MSACSELPVIPGLLAPQAAAQEVRWPGGVQPEYYSRTTRCMLLKTDRLSWRNSFTPWSLCTCGSVVHKHMPIPLLTLQNAKRYPKSWFAGQPEPELKQGF